MPGQQIPSLQWVAPVKVTGAFLFRYGPAAFNDFSGVQLAMADSCFV
jgi:hypothetical protein